MPRAAQPPKIDACYDEAWKQTPLAGPRRWLSLQSLSRAAKLRPTFTPTSGSPLRAIRNSISAFHCFDSGSTRHDRTQSAAATQQQTRQKSKQNTRVSAYYWNRASAWIRPPPARPAYLPCSSKPRAGSPY